MSKPKPATFADTTPHLPASTHRRCRNCGHWVPLNLICVRDGEPWCVACWREDKGLGHGAKCNIKQLEERMDAIERRMQAAAETAGTLAGLRKLAEEGANGETTS